MITIGPGGGEIQTNEAVASLSRSNSGSQEDSTSSYLPQSTVAQQVAGLGASIGRAMQSDEDGTGVVPAQVDRPKNKACIPCRQHKRKCDSLRPCRSCLMRSCADDCKDEAKGYACALCRRYSSRQSGCIVYGTDYAHFLRAEI